MITITLFIVIAYLFGSLASAIIVCKIMHLPDPRTAGSTNPGATNVLRIGGKLPALLVLVGDMLKGAIPVFLARIFGLDGFALAFVGLAALIGHLFPIFFGFKGGKGVATFLGAILSLSFFVGLLCLITWLVIAVIFRYSSLAALVSAVLAPVYVIFFSNPRYLIPIIFMIALLFWKHLDNIARLRSKTESRISLK